MALSGLLGWVPVARISGGKASMARWVSNKASLASSMARSRSGPTGFWAMAWTDSRSSCAAFINASIDGVYTGLTDLTLALSDDEVLLPAV